MTVLIGLTIILVLMLSESVSAGHTESLPRAIYSLLMVLCVLVAPLFASLPIWLRNTRFRWGDLSTPMYLPRWFVPLHMATWFISVLTIAAVLQWHDVVRDDWQIDQLLLDELLIMGPCLLSLVLSWLVLFEWQKLSAPDDVSLPSRMRFLSIQCRVHLLVILAPLLVMIVIKDSRDVLGPLPVLAKNLLILATVSAALCLMPFLVKLIWRNRPLTVKEGRQTLLDLCAAHRMRVRDVRVWETGGQVVNAVVTGILPGFRLLMISDRLLSSYPEHELRAILRHEAGHVRLRHLPIRIGFILLPAFSLAAMELDPDHVLQAFFHPLITNHGWPVDYRLFLGLMFLVYITAITAWLSRNMEIEADLYAIGACAPDGHLSPPVATRLAQAMTDALLRFAYHYPEQVDRSSMTHPSLMRRIDMIRLAAKDPKLASRFRMKFAIGQCLIATLILTLTVTCLLV